MIELNKFKTFADRMVYVSSKFHKDCEQLAKINLTEEEKEKFVFDMIDTFGAILKLEKENPPVPFAEFDLDPLGLQSKRVETLIEVPKDKIRGIKALRALSYEMAKVGVGVSMGLKESKDEVERVYDYQNNKWFHPIWECQGHLIGKNLGL